MSLLYDLLDHVVYLHTLYTLQGISETIVKQLIEFAYTGNIAVGKENVKDLLSAASKCTIKLFLKIIARILAKFKSIPIIVKLSQNISFSTDSD